MKLFIVLVAIALAQADKLDRVYLPANAQSSAGSNFVQTPHHSSNGLQNNAYSGAPASNAFGQNAYSGAPASNALQNNAYSGAPASNAFDQNAYSGAPASNALQNNAYSGAPASNAFGQNAYSGAPASNALGQNAYSGAPAPNAYAQSVYSDTPGSTAFAQNGYSGAPASNGYSSFNASPERPQAAFERNAAILRQDYTNDGQRYSYAYETQNGISADESGVVTHGTQAQGGYSYTGDDGKVYTVRYTADENGFVPQGDHLPTPPPIPEAILKSLEVIARAKAAGGYDGEGYNNSGNGQQQYYNTNAQPDNYNINLSSLDRAYLPPF